MRKSPYPLKNHPTHIDNFTVRSHLSSHAMIQGKQLQVLQKQKKAETGRDKQFLINGVDYYAEQIVAHQPAEVLETVFAVKGDYFYLKKGEIVNIRYVIGQYAEVKFQSKMGNTPIAKVGYFPTKLFRLIEGQRIEPALKMSTEKSFSKRRFQI